MSVNDNTLSLRALVLITCITIIIFVVGIILLALGYNEAFYSPDLTIRLIFEVFTNIGSTTVFIVLIGVFYIAYDKNFAKNLTLNLLFAVYLNSLLKDLFQDPRPSTNVDPNEVTEENPQGLIETGYGFPSGHSQQAVMIWGYIGFEFKERITIKNISIVPILTSILSFLVIISRVIVGVHDLQDIVGGTLIGIVSLLGVIFLMPILIRWFNKRTIWVHMVIGTIISIILFVVGIAFFPTSGEGLLPNPVPFSDSGSYALVGGVLLGLSIGYPLENEYIKYNPKELSTRQKIVNLVIGLSLLLITYFVLEIILHGNVVLRFIRYSILALIFSLVAPFIFSKLNKKTAGT